LLKKEKKGRKLSKQATQTGPWVRREKLGHYFKDEEGRGTETLTTTWEVIPEGGKVDQPESWPRSGGLGRETGSRGGGEKRQRQSRTVWLDRGGSAGEMHTPRGGDGETWVGRGGETGGGKKKKKRSDRLGQKNKKKNRRVNPKGRMIREKGAKREKKGRKMAFWKPAEEVKNTNIGKRVLGGRGGKEVIKQKKTDEEKKRRARQKRTLGEKLKDLPVKRKENSTEQPVKKNMKGKSARVPQSRGRGWQTGQKGGKSVGGEKRKRTSKTVH